MLKCAEVAHDLRQMAGEVTLQGLHDLGMGGCRLVLVHVLRAESHMACAQRGRRRKVALGRQTGA